MNNHLPIIRLQIEDVKYQIMHHFLDHQDQITNAVKKEITRVLDNFDFAEAMKAEIPGALNLIIKNYFGQYGEGYEMLKKAVDEAFIKIINGRK